MIELPARVAVVDDASMGPSPESDGNRSFWDDVDGLQPASMGPSPESDGNELADDTAAQPGKGFNGAVARERRKC